MHTSLLNSQHNSSYSKGRKGNLLTRAGVVASYCEVLPPKVLCDNFSHKKLGFDKSRNC